MKRTALATFIAAAALIATPSFGAQAYPDRCGEPAASGGVNLDIQGRSAISSCSGVAPNAYRTETAPGAPDASVFVLHGRAQGAGRQAP
jgi:hypothetical protein